MVKPDEVQIREESKSGFCPETNTYHSLSPPAPLPPPNSSISLSNYVFSLFHTTSNSSPENTTTALIDSVTGGRLSYSEFIHQVDSLADSLQTQIGLCKGDIAFVLSPPSLHIPILYFSLFSLGVVISPSNPTSSVSEIAYQIKLSKPTIAFATSKTSRKLPSFHYPTILLDSPDFDSMMKKKKTIPNHLVEKVTQSDTAMILYSSGTTGRVKGVMLSHRNLTSSIAGIYALQTKLRASSGGGAGGVVLCTVPLFHVYGLVYILKVVAMGETLVMMDRFDLRKMMKAVEDFKVTQLVVAPPVVLAMAKGDPRAENYDLSSLRTVACGGAPLLMEVISRFRERFPNVAIAQGYGLTETAAGVFRAVGPYETSRLGSTGRLIANHQAKIVDPETGSLLPPFVQGELWLKGPSIMKGYVGEEENTTATLDSDGWWFKTGDLCYIDGEGFLFFVERLKELIKYKGYQVPPAELEELLLSHPEVIDAAVIPYPNEEAGQVPMAFVVKRQRSSLDESEVIDFIAKQVSPYKKIRKVAFIESIPKNAPGKILRKELIKLALSSSRVAKL